MAEHPNVEATRSAIEALMKGDLETMAAGIADDAVWHVPGNHAWSGDYRGKADIVGRFQRMAEAGLSTAVEEIHDVVGNDEHVVAMVRFAITTPAGSVTQSSVWIFHVADGKAVEFWARNEDQGAIDALIGS